VTRKGEEYVLRSLTEPDLT